MSADAPWQQVGGYRRGDEVTLRARPDWRGCVTLPMVRRLVVRWEQGPPAGAYGTYLPERIARPGP